MNNVRIHPTAIIETEDIGEGTVIWAYSHVSKGVKIGKDCMIGEGVHVGNDVVIGNGCKIQNQCLVYRGVQMCDLVFLGPNVITTNDLYPRAFGNWEDRFRETKFKEGVSVGANCTIVCGITLGEYCMIGAGSVVRKNVDRLSLVVGNPARHIRYMDDVNS
jgi:UDP-2-acetamido-3-amino-2,3-dideoxy-glucuronate N-acetyltransferase